MCVALLVPGPTGEIINFVWARQNSKMSHFIPPGSRPSTLFYYKKKGSTWCGGMTVRIVVHGDVYCV